MGGACEGYHLKGSICQFPLVETLSTTSLNRKKAFPAHRVSLARPLCVGMRNIFCSTWFRTRNLCNIAPATRDYYTKPWIHAF